MHARPFSAIAVCALLVVAGTLRAQETTSSASLAGTSRRSLFTAEELDRARTIAAERQERQESYIRASHDDDVIILAPYIVEGDNSLLLARLRRDLEQGSGSRWHSRFVVKTPTLQPMHFPRKYDYLFFNGPSPGAPADRVKGVDWLGVAVGVVTAVLQKRTGDIFRAPEPVSDQ